MAAMRFFTAFCTFSKARTSIWRTRSRETPNSRRQILQRDRIVGQPARLEDAPLALVEHVERADQRLVAVILLLALGQDALLAGRCRRPASPSIRR